MHRNNEAIKLKDSINHSKLLFHGDDDDLTWNVIIDDVIKGYNDLGGFDFHPRHRREAPFTNFESPDILYQTDEFIIGIEHFEIDSSRKTRRGSTLKNDRMKIDREVNLEYYTQNSSYYYSEKKLESRLSYDNYKNTLVGTFKQHISHLSEYKNNIQKIAHNKKVLFAFYIEDTTTLGNYIMTEFGRETLNPLCIREFIDLLVEYKGINYILTRVQRDYLYTLHIQQITDEYIQSLYNQCYNTDKDEFITYTPVIISQIGDK